MKTKTMFFVFALLTVAAMVFAAGGQAADAEDDFPNRPIRWISTAGPGGAAETFMRLVAPYVEKHLGVPLRIESIDGGSGVIGTTVVKNAPADGYTIANRGSFTIVQNMLVQKADFTLDDFDFIARVVNDPIVLFVRKDSPFNNMKDLVEYAKTQPPKTVSVSFANATDNAGLGFRQMQDAAGVQFNIISYNSGNNARLALLRGEVDASCANWFGASAIWDDSKVLGVMSGERSSVPAIRDIPTASEQLGINTSTVPTTYAIYGPAGIKANYPARFQKLYDAFRLGLSDPELLQKLKDMDQDGYLDVIGPEEVTKEMQNHWDVANSLLPLMLADY